MIRKIACLAVIFMTLPINVTIANINQPPTSAKLKYIANSALKTYFQKYQKKEYFSGIGLAIGLKNHPIQSFYMGTVSHSTNSKPVNSKSLFQIGSITKSFTAVSILQLVAANKIKLSDPVSKYLPRYKKWGHITIEQLLNMSSGLPNYSDSPSWNYQESQNIERVWTLPELVQFVYPQKPFNPPLKSGYFYCNTGYLLTEMIIAKITQKSFKQNVLADIVKPLHLMHTFYPVPSISTKLISDLAHGYGYNQYDNPALVGKDMQLNNMSWGAAAGGMIGTAADIVQWVRDLFINEKLLNQTQKKALMRLISIKTGKPIQQTTPDDPKGFGLGVVQAYNPAIGRFWYYEGETLGFRAIYIYVPCNQVIVAATVNSATNGENDHIHSLLQNMYQALLQNYPQYQCKAT